MRDLASLLVCPRCRGPVVGEEQRLVCQACAIDYPSLGAIPCLVPDPDEAVARWRGMAAAHLQGAGAAVERCLSELLHPEPLLVATRRRLRRIAAAMEGNRAQTEALLAKAGLVGDGTTPVDPRALAGEEMRLVQFHELILRDWGWGDDGVGENRIALETLESVLEPGRPLGRVLVLGAGACRLPYDLHQRHAPELTLALDVNPLPFLVAHEVIFGDGLTLADLAVSPHEPGVEGAMMRLHAPSGPVAGMHLVLADGLAPPVRAGAFDTVITTWFIDQVPSDVRDFVRVVRAACAPGGRWINSGPLMYPSARSRARRYARDEILELLAEAGFLVTRTRASHVPYLFSPRSSSGRYAHVWTFAADLVEKPNPSVRAQLPPWAEAWDVPVPRFDGIDDYPLRHPVFASIAAAVDGRASIDEIARRVPAGPLGAEAWRRAVRAVLLELMDAGAS